MNSKHEGHVWPPNASPQGAHGKNEAKYCGVCLGHLRVCLLTDESEKLPLDKRQFGRVEATLMVDKDNKTFYTTGCTILLGMVSAKVSRL